MTDGPPTPNPRLVLAIIVGIIAVQGVYAALDIVGGGVDLGEPLQLVTVAAFVVYAALIAALAFGVWRRQPWAWPLAVVTTATGLGLVGLRVLGGDGVEEHLLGLAIDGALLYYLFKPDIRAMFDA